MPLDSNKALYAEENGRFSIRSDIDIDEPGEGELLIETLYSGVNPADIKHSTRLGIRATVLGYDFCGKVLAAPSSSKFSKGDIVAGYTPTNLGRPSKYGTHQVRCVCPENMAFKVPSNLPRSHAAALTTVAMTAADALYNFFKFPLPTAPRKIPGPILIWGASSSVGICAVQFAKASGVQNIFVTASPGRHELLKRLGATQCFDYSDSNVVSNVVAAVERLGNGPIQYAVDAVGSESNPSSADLMERCVTDAKPKLLSVILRQGKQFDMPVAMTKDDFVIQPPGVPEPIRIPSRPDDHWQTWKAVEWAVENYGKGLELPNVDVFEGAAENALVEVEKVAGPGRGFGKLVLKHPLQ